MPVRRRTREEGPEERRGPGRRYEPAYDGGRDGDIDEDIEDEEIDDDESPDAEDEEDEEFAEPPRRRVERPERRRRPRPLPPNLAAQAGMRHIAELTGKETGGVISLEPDDDDGWVVGVEVIEDRRIPSSSDILGLYRVGVDADGALIGYRRTKRYARGRGGSGEVS